MEENFLKEYSVKTINNFLDTYIIWNSKMNTSSHITCINVSKCSVFDLIIFFWKFLVPTKFFYTNALLLLSYNNEVCHFYAYKIFIYIVFGTLFWYNPQGLSVNRFDHFGDFFVVYFFRQTERRKSLMWKKASSIQLLLW